MLEDGFFKILGGSPLMYSYLMKRYENEIGHILMPTDLDLSIKGVLGWHNAKLRPASEQISKMILESKSYSSPPTLAAYKKWTNEFIDAFEAIDGKLKKDSLPYLCGRVTTIADIIIFNELSQFLFITKLDFTHEKLATMEKLKYWYEIQMPVDEIVVALDARMRTYLATKPMNIPSK